MFKRSFFQTAVVLAAAFSLGQAQAQTAPFKFQLDWRLEGPSALLLSPAAAPSRFLPANAMLVVLPKK